MMRTHIITIVSRESTHYAIEASTPEQAIEQAKSDWNDGIVDRQVSLGNEFAEIENAYADDERLGE
jgi:hypothetical protein